MRDGGVTKLWLAGLFAAGANAIVRGVNLGGWLVTEPWMTPSLFNATATVDEWHLCNVLGKDQCLQTLQNHWSTFYTHDDFLAIRAAGLRYESAEPRLPQCYSVRIPLGYWAVDLLDYEPYVSGQYPYLINAVNWAHELNLTVFIDLHGVPGSQNGWEESGLVGPIGFIDNSSNTDRTLNVLRNLTSEFTKSSYGGAVTNIELINEPLFGMAPLQKFYTVGAQAIGSANSTINVTISDGFFEPHSWKNYDPSNPSATSPAPHLTVDTHQFWAFPPLNNLSTTEILQQVCDLGQQIRQPNSGIPPTLVGEWSLSTGKLTRSSITANSTIPAEQDQGKRTWFRQLFEAQNAAFTPYGPGQPSIGWYFWAWKTEYDIDAWSYRKGLADQYIPSDISNSSTLVFPVMDNGCIDTTFDYTAPASVSSTASSTASATAGSTATTSASVTTMDSSTTPKSTAGTTFSTGWLKPSVAVVTLIILGLCY